MNFDHLCAGVADRLALCLHSSSNRTLTDGNLCYPQMNASRWVWLHLVALNGAP